MGYWFGGTYWGAEHALLGKDVSNSMFNYEWMHDSIVRYELTLRKGNGCTRSTRSMLLSSHA